MRPFLTTLVTIWGICALMGCESAGGGYDGVSRFADRPYYGPGSVPREAAPDTSTGTGAMPHTRNG